MTPEEHIMISQASRQVERMLTSTIPMVEVLAKAATAAEATGLAMAAWFMRDSMVVYANEMQKFLAGFDYDEDDDGLDY